MSRSRRSDPDFYPFLQQSHRHLDRAGEALVEVVETDDRAEILRRWRELEGQLLAHLEAEERNVLPEFAKTDRVEAVGLLREHGMIRERLLELGVDVELHCLRLDALRDFIRLLRDHAAREEDGALYRWVSSRLATRH